MALEKGVFNLTSLYGAISQCDYQPFWKNGLLPIGVSKNTEFELCKKG